MPRVLCFDDKPEILENIKEIISSWDDSLHGTFEVFGESDFNSVVERLKVERFDLVTLDLHGGNDPDPLKDDGEQGAQEGLRVLNELRSVRFIPVVFYTGYAEKIKSLESGVVKIVKKGENDLDGVRNAIDALYSTGVSRLLSKIEEENTRYLWDTIDKSWGDIQIDGGVEDLAYLVARRLGARLSREFIKEFLQHDPEKVSPIEVYIYPPHDESIKTGCVVRKDGGFWLVTTPACDFVQGKAESILLVAAKPLSSFSQYQEWVVNKRDSAEQKNPAYNKLYSLIGNKAGDRYRFLPGTFFVENLVVDFQELRQIPFADLKHSEVVCRVDSPFREELLNQFSRYYGRMGVPDLHIPSLINSFK
ncbi:hypothetical protein KDK82_2691 [Delftia sp. K82]|uniref:response regulator n=1 Tax=Delftia sp. K82 TaxID=1472718 RepID=UPI000B6AAA60|nr:response regulator [Delftia sp. K82]OWG19209.1 hypothetical protein KDK82_2691 [Delftia sp. K82]